MNIVRMNPWNWLRNEELRQHSPDAATRSFAFFPVDPFQGEMGKLLDSFFAPAAGRDKRAQQSAETALIRPNLDVSGDEKQYVVSVELPGVDEKDLKVELNNDILHIFGEKKQEFEENSDDKEGKGKGFYRIERSYGSFQRTLALPEDVDTSAISASHKNGVLSITLPRKKAVEPEKRVIAINKE